MELIRDTHDPSMHLKTIEDELKGTIGQALGKQGRKIHRFMGLMQESYDDYQAAMAEHEQESSSHYTRRVQGSNNSNSKTAIERAKEAAAQFNDYRQLAVTARWELQVHRQAAGFVINNHNYVRDHYPIPEALPDLDEKGNEIPKEEKKTFDKFGDQLDWWQRVGRWK